MSKSELTALSYVRHQMGKYHQLWSHAQLLARLTEFLRQPLPRSVAEHCEVANFRNEELVIGTDSSAWAARLRFHTPQILSHLATHPTIAVRRITIRVLPPSAVVAPRLRNRMKISRNSGEVLEQTARTVTDPRLQAALHKLATRAR